MSEEFSPLDQLEAQRVSPLEQIIDDSHETEARAQAGGWSDQELIRGIAFETVIQALATSGWSREEAETIVEESRQRTRAERGVVTREMVAKVVEKRYRRMLSSVRWIAFGGFPALMIGARNILASLRALRSGRRGG